MKKSIYSASILLTIFLVFGLSSCTKQQYCAQCYESVSGYQADDFCGESDEVDTYIEELYDTGASLGQNWSCNKVEE